MFKDYMWDGLYGSLCRHLLYEHHSAVLKIEFPFAVDKGPSTAVSDDTRNQHNCSSQERREGGHVQ